MTPALPIHPGRLVPDAEASGEPHASTMSEARFHEFYNATAKPLKKYLQRITGDAALADDLLQETYVRLLHRAPSTLDLAQSKSYLFRVATNLARDQFRRRRFQAAPLDERASALPLDAGGGHAADLDKVLQQISPQHRELMWLAYVEGASHREIAEVTGLKEGSIRLVLFRVRHKLAEILRRRGVSREDVR
jgi:RNA polymerase sigma-70 factor, ECF subfamily